MRALARMPPQASSLMPMLTKNDRKDPNAAFIAPDVDCRDTIISPTSAPTNGPAMGPHGHGKNMPTNKPIIAPHSPPLPPPNRRVIHGVRNMSSIVSINVITPHIISVGVLTVTYPLQCASSSAR